mgnify:CR=1 FL=1
MTQYQQEEINMIMALLQSQSGGRRTARSIAMSCNSVERSVRTFCHHSKNLDEKNDIYLKAHVCERLIFLTNLKDHWAWIGHWGNTFDLDDEGVSWGEYLYNSMTNDEMKTTFKLLTKCTCCKRHQDLHGINKKNYNTIHQCNCKCRHYARWIRRCLIYQNIEVPYEGIEAGEISRMRSFEETIKN